MAVDEKPDVAQFLARMPTGKDMAFSLVRVIIVLAVALWVWPTTGLGRTVESFYRRVNKVAVSIIGAQETVKVEELPVEGKPDMTRTRKTVTRRKVPMALSSDTFFPVLLPLILFSAAPLRSFRRTLRHALVALVLGGAFFGVVTVAHSYYAESVRLAQGKYVGTRGENACLVSIGMLAPLFATLLAPWVASLIATVPTRVFHWLRKTAVNAMPTTPVPAVGRNDPCPCGSGKKYKKCCGKT